MKNYEVNFDGIVGPNHNYAGLAAGNLASQNNRQCVSHPKQAALQGLQKMKLLNDLGIKQAVLPPQERPNLELLRQLGFEGNARKLLNDSAKQAPHLLAAVYSASAMWAANCATVSPSIDSQDKKLHLTPANLISNFHRSQEGRVNESMLKKIFHNEKYFSVHQALPKSEDYADEGAANHLSFRTNSSSPSLQVFVYGKGGSQTPAQKYSPRQSIQASQAIARQHRLEPQKTLFFKQNPRAIDAGVFHNDVISSSNDNFFLVHHLAFTNQQQSLAQIEESYKLLNNDKALFIRQISENEFKLSDAIKSYIFNTQIVTLPDGTMSIIAPIECQEIDSAAKIISELIDGDSPISSCHFLNLRQSMSNGGGPACLRLRVPLNTLELQSIHQEVIFTDNLHQKLSSWVIKHYREELQPGDLADPLLITEIHHALDELTQILNFGSFYPFQQD